MCRITEVIPYKSRFKIKLQDTTEFLLYPSEIKKYHLTEDMLLEKSVLDEIMQILYRRAKERALYLLDRSYRTERQIQDKLRAGLYPPQVISQVLSYLKEYHLVDDYRYAQMYIDYKRNKKSRRQMVQDLLFKGISKEVVESAFEDSDFTDGDSLSCFIQKGKQRYDLSDKKAVQKFYRYLLSKGYSYDDVRSALETVTDYDG